MSKKIDGSWGLFRRHISFSGGMFLNLSTRQVQLLADILEQNIDYTDGHALNIIRDLTRMGLVHGQKGSQHQITEPGRQLLGLLGACATQQESFKMAV
ncbi:MAG: MarR family transcriptional regulator [Gammaproteobacteria bacterium]|nr:MarR family transcriptional regulator [Gammaproteobacteria bacterium]